MRRIHWYGPTVVLLVTTLLVMITGPHLARRIAWASTESRIALVKRNLAGDPSLAQLSESFREVAEVVAPSVVHIEISAKDPSDARKLLRPFLPPRGFRLDPYWWRDRHGDEPEERAPDDDGEDYDQYNVPLDVSTGSGWVYDRDGHIVTNNHVVENADVITVRFQDGSQHKAEVVGRDPKTDTAVIRVDTKDLHPATIADEPVEQGDIVFAFGSPFEFEFSMSQGIVSGQGQTPAHPRPTSGL